MPVRQAVEAQRAIQLAAHDGAGDIGGVSLGGHLGLVGEFVDVERELVGERREFRVELNRELAGGSLGTAGHDDLALALVEVVDFDRAFDSAELLA